MTIDDERWEAIDRARRFLRELARLDYPNEPPWYPECAGRMPKAVRRYAMSLLRHYPEEWWAKNRKDK